MGWGLMVGFLAGVFSQRVLGRLRRRTPPHAQMLAWVQHRAGALAVEDFLALRIVAMRRGMKTGDALAGAARFAFLSRNGSDGQRAESWEFIAAARTMIADEGLLRHLQEDKRAWYVEEAMRKGGLPLHPFE